MEDGWSGMEAGTNDSCVREREGNDTRKGTPVEPKHLTEAELSFPWRVVTSIAAGTPETPCSSWYRRSFSVRGMLQGKKVGSGLEPCLPEAGVIGILCHWDGQPGASCPTSPPGNVFPGLSILLPSLDACPQGDQCRESPVPWSWSQFQSTWKQQGHKQGAGQQESLHVAEGTANQEGPSGWAGSLEPFIAELGGWPGAGEGLHFQIMSHHKGHIVLPLLVEQTLNPFPQGVNVMPQCLRWAW